MLIILVLFALINTLRGVPLSLPLEVSDGFTNLDIRDTQDHLGQRQVNDIIVSCFVTIFACTWSAVHPNIPAPTDSEWTRFKRQVTIMIYALLAPELMILWAWNQRRGARKIMTEYNNALTDQLYLCLDQKFDQRWFQAIFGVIKELFQDSPYPRKLEEGKGPQWTLAHGFFIQMGGFMLCENGQPIQILTAEDSDDETSIVWNIKKGIIDPPRLSEEEIKDRSKGDTISKTFIALQTTWFVVQCIARWSQQLPVTELEVVTLAFATLNSITYAVWWNKPQNVGQTVFLESKKPPDFKGILAESSGTSDGGTSTNAENNALSPPPNAVKESWLRRKLRQDIQKHSYSPTLFLSVPFRVLQAVLRPLGNMTTGRQTSALKTRVGMFYSSNHGGIQAGYTTAAIGTLFGSIHLIPSWFFNFSSRQEMWLWRISAIIITFEPVLLGVVSCKLKSRYLEVLTGIFGLLMIFGVPFYIISRIVILTLSLTSLRSLSPAALQTIEWTTFIPHL